MVEVEMKLRPSEQVQSIGRDLLNFRKSPEALLTLYRDDPEGKSFTP